MTRRRPEGASATYQERRLGVASSPARRIDQGLLVSDLGTFGIPMHARDVIPPGVVAYQVVDAHHGYAAAEAELLRQGFGHARSWHYEALGHPQSFLDGEGRLVVRWIRLLVRKRGEGGKPDVTPWRGNPLPARRRGEGERDFISRCMRWQHRSGEAGRRFSAPGQAAAVCYAQARRNPDDKLRELERAAESDPIARQELAVWRLRSGLEARAAADPGQWWDAWAIERLHADLGPPTLNDQHVTGHLYEQAHTVYMDSPTSGYAVVVVWPVSWLVGFRYEVEPVDAGPADAFGRTWRVRHGEPARLVAPVDSREAEHRARFLAEERLRLRLGLPPIEGPPPPWLRNPDDEIRRLERETAAGDAQARKRLGAAHARAGGHGSRTFGGRLLPPGVTIERLPDFQELGRYALVVSGQSWIVFRDPHDRKWYLDPSQEPERAGIWWTASLGDTLEESIETLLRRRSPPRQNPDDHVRRAERGKGESPEAEARWIAQLVRAGKVFPEQVAWVAQLGDAASILYAREAGIEVEDHPRNRGHWLENDAPGLPAMGAVVLAFGLLEDAPQSLERDAMLVAYRRWLEDAPWSSWTFRERLLQVDVDDDHGWIQVARLARQGVSGDPRHMASDFPSNDSWALIYQAARLLLRASHHTGDDWRARLGPQRDPILGALFRIVRTTNSARRRLKEWVLAGGRSRWGPS